MTNQIKYNWASLGTGVIANELAQALEALGGKLYSVANRTYDKGVAFAEKYGIEKVYEEIDQVFEDPEVKDWESYTGKYALVVTSTTGQGDLPDSIVPLYEGIKDMYQPHLRYGIIALGDSTYANFCGGGLKFDALLQEQGGTRVGDMLMIDASEDPEPESVSNPWVTQWATLLD